MSFEPVIGLEVHVELETRSKMFCSCPVVDSTNAEPNTAVCPVCAGMPGVLPVVNQRAVEYAIRVALALDCEIAPTSIFARKNYFYPDLPKGYQISQYEQPLAQHGQLQIITSQGARDIRIRRVHLEEDTGKLTHVYKNDQAYSLVDLNRAGIPLLEIVTEPDMHTAEEVREVATCLRSLLRYLRVNSGDLQKGVMRIEPNVSVRLVGTRELGTRTEIKNLNSFRALERSIEYEIRRQSDLLSQGNSVMQETLGWDDTLEVTLSQRSKEEAHDYRYFPEPDLPPLVVEPAWVAQIRQSLPELPAARFSRFQQQYNLTPYDANVLTAEQEAADYFEQVVSAAPGIPAKIIANWITGELFGLLNQSAASIAACPVKPGALADLIQMVAKKDINHSTAKTVLAQMAQTGQTADQIVTGKELRQISDQSAVARLVSQVITDNPAQVASFISGKENIARWLFGQVMRLAQGKADPQVVQQELERQLNEQKPD